MDQRQLAAVRATSTRARISPTSFVNEYHWGGYSGDPRRLMERFYDAFLYLANWSTRELMLRFPSRLVPLEVVERYCGGDSVSAWSSGEHLVIAALSDEEPDGDVEGGEGWLASILPVRAEVLSGDERALYLLWLLAVQSGAVDEDAVEPPVPPGLGALTGSQAALTDFLRIDLDLVAAAASAASEPATPDIDRFVAGLPAATRDALLVDLLRGDDPHRRAQTVRALRTTSQAGGRTVAALLGMAAAERERRQRAQRERRDREAAARAQSAEQARRERLTRLEAEGEGAWRRVASRIAEKRPAAYDIAVDLLIDLREIADSTVFAARVDDLRREHARKPALMERLIAAGF